MANTRALDRPYAELRRPRRRYHNRHSLGDSVAYHGQRVASPARRARDTPRISRGLPATCTYRLTCGSGRRVAQMGRRPALAAEPRTRLVETPDRSPKRDEQPMTVLASQTPTARTSAGRALVPQDAAARSRARFAAVVEQRSRAIISYLTRLVRDSHVAEDLAQEVFLRLHQTWDRIEERTMQAWLYRVARNLATDWFRKKKALPFSAVSGAGSDDDDGSMSPAHWLEDRHGAPEEHAYRAELHRLVEAAIVGLSVKLREVFVLCDVERLSYREAADVLGCNVKTISSRLARARERFQATVSPYLEQGRDRRALTNP